MTSTCSSVVETFGRHQRGFYLLEFWSPPLSNGTGSGVHSMYQYHILMNFLGFYTFLLQISYDCSQNSHPCLGLTSTEIKIEIWISFFLILLEMVRYCKSKNVQQWLMVLGKAGRVDWGCRIHWLHLCISSNECTDMTQSNLMVRLQLWWSCGKCGVSLHYHRSQIQSGLELKHPIRSYLWIDQIELFDI